MQKKLSCILVATGTLLGALPGPLGNRAAVCNTPNCPIVIECGIGSPCDKSGTKYRIRRLVVTTHDGRSLTGPRDEQSWELAPVIRTGGVDNQRAMKIRMHKRHHHYRRQLNAARHSGRHALATMRKAHHHRSFPLARGHDHARRQAT